MRLVKRQIIIALTIACVGFSIIAVHDFWMQRSIVKQINAEDETRIVNAVKVHFDTIIAQATKQIELIASFPYINYIAQQEGFRKFKMIQLATSEFERLSQPLSFLSEFRLIQVQHEYFEEIIKLQRYGGTKQLLSTRELNAINDKSEIDIWNDSLDGKVGVKKDDTGVVRVFYSVRDPLTSNILFVVDGKIPLSELLASVNLVAEGYEVSLCNQSIEQGCATSGYVDNLSFKLKRTVPSARTNIFQWLSFFLVLLFAVALSLGIAFWLAKRNIKPAVRLIDYTKKLRNDLKTESSPFSDELGDVWKGLNEFVDKIKEREKELKETASLVAIGRTTAMVAHDVRRPLASVKALLNVLPAIQNDPERVKKMAAEVDRAITSTNSLLNDIMDFSKDSTALDLSDHGPDSFIIAAIGEALRSHPEAEVKLEYEFGHETRPMHADSQRMIRVLTNIIGNALEAMTDKATGKACGNLFFTTYLAKRDGKEFVGISVADDGPGIPEEALSKLFDPFFTQGKKGGTGLGLAICQKVIDMHGGKISARNRGTCHPHAVPTGRQESGDPVNARDSRFRGNDIADGNDSVRGAEFVIEVPAGEGRRPMNHADIIDHSSELKLFREEEAKREDIGDTASTAEFMRINKERGRISTLLVVDDEPLFRETIRSTLNTLGQVKDLVKVIEVDSAETGLKVFEAREFDYVIADIDMGRGKMNGYTFAQKILEEHPTTYVLIHSNKRKAELDERIRQVCHPRAVPTGRQESGDPVNAGDSRLRGNDIHFLGFLPKPMKPSELLQFLACKGFEERVIARRLPAGRQAKATKQSSEINCMHGIASSAVPPRNDKQPTALLLNDDESLIFCFSDDLKKLGYQVLDAKNVSSAMEHFANRKIDMIVSDINLGERELTGYDFLSKVREKDAKIPFVFTSGYNRRDEWEKAEKAGATEYLQIPYELHELKKALGV